MGGCLLTVSAQLLDQGGIVCELADLLRQLFRRFWSHYYTRFGVPYDLGRFSFWNTYYQGHTHSHGLEDFAGDNRAKEAGVLKRHQGDGA